VSPVLSRNESGAELFDADNAHVLQTKLILLDAPLVLFMAMSFYCYVRFHKLRYKFVPFRSSDESILTKLLSQRLYATVVDMDDPHGSFPQSDNIVQDGGTLCVLDGRNGGPHRHVDPARHPTRTLDRESAPPVCPNRH
jgi:hypothetical protein